MGFRLMERMKIDDKQSNKKAIRILEVMPYFASKIPPTSGPSTEPNIHDVLLQVMANERSSLLTSNGNNENDEGAKKALIKPLINIPA